ncbi:MAG: TIGR03560 family F420-dependent LLM class oxidoreductase [Candidatus Heimdallarchaeota archaeon]
MKIGLQIPNLTFPKGRDSFSEDFRKIVQTADESGFSSLWVMDHFFQIGGPESHLLGPAEDDMYESYSLLNYAAALTSNVKLGTMVTGNNYRHPGMLVKAVTTLDILSKGRAYFGIGAGWFERESIGLGIPFFNWKIRFEMLEESLQIIKQMWSDNDGEYKGKHYQLKETLCSPPPIQQFPPILIGGMGPNKTLRFVAKYADACNLFLGGGIEKVEEALETLKRHCRTEGRNYDEIEKTTLGSVFLDQPNVPEKSARGSKNLKSVEDILSMLKTLADMGIDHAIFNMRNPLSDQEPLSIFQDEIIPFARAF